MTGNDRGKNVDVCAAKIKTTFHFAVHVNRLDCSHRMHETRFSRSLCQTWLLLLVI